MSHPEQMAFLRAVVGANQELVAEGRILEVGSYDVNGSVRGLFGSSASYVGVDLSDGPGVDLVGFGHEVSLPDNSFDIAVSAECFEHDPHWAETLANMVRMTRPGGIVAVTCATVGRPEHGTRRTRRDESPGTQAVGIDYYRNLTEGDLAAAVPLASMFSESQFWSCRSSFDLYFVGVVRGASRGVIGRLPDDSVLRSIDRLMSRTERAVRLPLRAAKLFVRREDKYQNLILDYWAMVQRLRTSVSLSRFRRLLQQL